LILEGEREGQRSVAETRKSDRSRNNERGSSVSVSSFGSCRRRKRLFFWPGDCWKLILRVLTWVEAFHDVEKAEGKGRGERDGQEGEKSWAERAVFSLPFSTPPSSPSPQPHRPSPRHLLFLQLQPPTLSPRRSGFYGKSRTSFSRADITRKTPSQKLTSPPPFCSFLFSPLRPRRPH